LALSKLLLSLVGADSNVLKITDEKTTAKLIVSKILEAIKEDYQFFQL
jgi:hypothetical protein